MTDVDKLVAEMNRRKKRAESLALPEALCSFYDKARFYPSWKNNQPLLIPKGVEDLDGASDSVKFIYQGERYSV